MNGSRGVRQVWAPLPGVPVVIALSTAPLRASLSGARRRPQLWSLHMLRHFGLAKATGWTPLRAGRAIPARVGLVVGCMEIIE